MSGRKELFRARVTFNEKTIQRVFKVEYFTYDKLKVILRAIVGFLFIAMAFLVEMHLALMVLCLLIGCWLFIALDFPSKVRAEGVIQARKGAVNTISMKFYDSSIEVVEEKRFYNYSEIDRLIADKDFLFIFYSRQKALMVDTSTLQPSNISDFRNLIAEKSGKRWRMNSILLMNFKDLKQAIKDFRERKKIT